MPTYEALAAFQRQSGEPDAAQKSAFRRALAVFVANLKTGGAFSPELRVHRLVNTEIWSLTFAKDGRALLRYGDQITDGQPHIVWEAVGSQDEAYNFKK